MTVSKVFAREVAAVLSRLGISQREAAKRARVSPGYVSNMCLGQVPSLGKLLQFAGGLGVDPEPLIAAAGYPQVGRAESLPALHAGERADCAVPLLGDAPAGDWRQAAEACENYPIHQRHQQVTDFCLRVTGDSMWPHLQDGDVVGVKAQSTADVGQVVVARLGDALTVKRLLYQRGKWYLEPFNPTYQPLPVTLDDPDFAIIGIVAWHTHDWLNPGPLREQPLDEGPTLLDHHR